MATLIGALVDTSRSMSRYYSSGVKRQDEKWARSIFKVVDNLIKNDVSQSNKVFALAFGASKEPYKFDLLSTAAGAPKLPVHHDRSKEDIVEHILSFLEVNGAPRVRYLASRELLCESIEHFYASIILEKLQTDEYFRSKFVFDCLPKSCRTKPEKVISIGYAKEKAYQGACLVGANDFLIKEVIAKGMQLLPPYVITISPRAIFDVHKASDVLHGRVGDEELTNKRVDKMQ